MNLDEMFAASGCRYLIKVSSIKSFSDLHKLLIKHYKVTPSQLKSFNSQATRPLGDTNYDVKLRKLGYTHTFKPIVTKEIFFYFDHPQSLDDIRVAYHHKFKFAVQGISLKSLRNLYHDVFTVSGPFIHWFVGDRDDEKSRDILYNHYISDKFAAPFKLHLIDDHFDVARPAFKCDCLKFQYGTGIVRAMGDTLKKGWYALHTCNVHKDGSIIQPVNNIDGNAIQYVRSGMVSISPQLKDLYPALVTWASIADPDPSITRNANGGRFSRHTFDSFPIAIGSPEYHECLLHDAFSLEMVDLLKTTYLTKVRDGFHSQR